jgi:hypothetical protein
MEKRAPSISPFLVGLFLATVVGILFISTRGVDIKRFLFRRIKAMLRQKFKMLFISAFLRLIAKNVNK